MANNRILFQDMKKHRNRKGYYKVGNLLLKDTKNGTVLLSQSRIHDAQFIKYLQEIDAASDGEIKAHQVISMLASVAFNSGLRLK